MSDPDRFVSFAQHGEDVILWRALGDRGACFYVDVGAFDPSYDSVTRALYERGWRGINFEPQPDRLAAFEAARPEDINLSVAIGDQDGMATLRLPANPGWATIVEGSQIGDDDYPVSKFEVPVRRLDTLLPELGITHVDVLKIDAEGAEAAVVRGLLGGPTRPLVCVIEGVAPGVGRTAGDEAVSLLVEAGYAHCLFDGLNHYLTIDPELAAALSVPANPLDDYSRAAMADLEEERPQLIASIAALAAENLSLRITKADSLARAPRAAQNRRRPDRDLAQEAGEPSVIDWPTTEAARKGAQALLVEDESRTRGGRDPRALELDVRAERRRLTFQKLLRVEKAPLNGSLEPDLLSLAMTNLPPIEAVSLLYLTILGRVADATGLADWVDRLDRGDTLLVIARKLAESPEAMARPARERARVRSDLVAWESITTLDELGVAVGRPGHTYTPGRVREEILVDALFEVALGRRPNPEEVRVETDKLIAGYGREWLIRSYAVRPEVRARFLGASAPGLRSRLSRWRNGRRYLENFRVLVAAAESRQVNQLLARFIDLDPSVVNRLQAMTRLIEDG